MAEIIQLYPDNTFEDRDRAELCDAVSKYGWFVLFVRQPANRERGYVYRKFPKGQPDWIIDGSNGEWDARDGRGRKIASRETPMELLDLVYDDVMDDYWLQRTS